MLKKLLYLPAIIHGIKRWQTGCYIIILLVGVFALINIKTSYAEVIQCGALNEKYKDTNCQPSCNESFPISASEGDGGCKQANLSWVCCGKKQPTTSTPAGTTSNSEKTVKILGETINTNSLDGFMQIAVAVSKWILGITGSLALLMFIYGGVMFLISSGSSEKVTQAKQIIIGAVIGLIIVFAAYTIIGFTFKAMGLEGEPWYQSGWFK